MEYRRFEGMEIWQYGRYHGVGDGTFECTDTWKYGTKRRGTGLTSSR